MHCAVKKVPRLLLWNGPSRSRSVSSIVSRSPVSLTMPQWTDFDDFGRTIMPSSVFTSFFQPRKPMLAIDLHESKKEYHIDCDVPGFTKDNIKVQRDGDLLTIKAERQEGSLKKDDDSKAHLLERPQHQQLEAVRQIRMPRDANMDEIKADFKNGSLTINIPKDESREIDLKDVSISSS